MVRQFIFRSPDWEDGYGGDLLSEPPPERRAWCDPDDRDSLAATLLECARDTIARVGWGEFENEAADPTCPELSPIWRKTPRVGSRWAGHVWDACTVEPDGNLRIVLRLTVRCVAWQPADMQDETRQRLVQGDSPLLRPHIPPDLDEDYYALSDGGSLVHPVELRLIHLPGSDGGEVWHEEWTDPLKPDNREDMNAALVKAATRIIEHEDENCFGPPGGETDSHFGRWLDMQRSCPDWKIERDQIFIDRAARQAARAAYAAADVPNTLPSIWAGHVWEAWGDEPGDRHRDWEFAGALYQRMTIRDVVWQDGRVAELVYDLDPRPKQSLTPRMPCAWTPRHRHSPAHPQLAAAS